MLQSSVTLPLCGVSCVYVFELIYLCICEWVGHVSVGNVCVCVGGGYVCAFINVYVYVWVNVCAHVSVHACLHNVFFIICERQLKSNIILISTELGVSELI